VDKGEGSPAITAVAPEEYVVRSLESLAEFEACFRLQEEVWGRGFRETAGVSILKASQRVGGVVGGALDESGDLVGFVFGLTGLEDGRPAHWSHMLAVKPGRRDGGLGQRLKSWQRERCRELGVRRMYWTFDPLVARNGWINLGRLGVVVREHVENMYGVSASPLHDGLGTDRLVAIWELDEPRVDDRLRRRGPPPPAWEDVLHLPCAFEVIGAGERARPSGAGRVSLDPDEALLVPVPADIQRLKAHDPALATAWRTATRFAFGDRLSRGWEVRELVRGPDAIYYYVLRPTRAE
jgi:predicted GNAT superfamily acetyltransferase